METTSISPAALSPDRFTGRRDPRDHRMIPRKKRERERERERERLAGNPAKLAG